MKSILEQYERLKDQCRLDEKIHWETLEVCRHFEQILKDNDFDQLPLTPVTITDDWSQLKIEQLSDGEYRLEVKENKEETRKQSFIVKIKILGDLWIRVEFYRHVQLYYYNSDQYGLLEIDHS